MWKVVAIKKGYEDTWRRLSTHPEQVMDLAAIVIFFPLKSLQQVTNNTIEGIEGPFSNKMIYKDLHNPCI